MAEVETADMTTHQMAELMVGETVDAVKSGTGPVDGELLFSVTALSREAHGPFDVPPAISVARTEISGTRRVTYTGTKVRGCRNIISAPFCPAAVSII